MYCKYLKYLLLFYLLHMTPMIGQGVATQERIREGYAEKGRSQFSRAFMPVFVHYLKRYFEQAPDRARFEVELAWALDRDPEVRELASSLLERFKLAFDRSETTLFDPEVYDLTQSRSLDLGRIRLLLAKALAEPSADLDSDEMSRFFGPVIPPDAPDQLSVENESFQPNPEFTDSKATGSLLVRWRDNSDNEDGFLIYRLVDGVEAAEPFVVPADIEEYYDDGLEFPKLGSSWTCYSVRAFKQSQLGITGHEPPRIVSEPAEPPACFSFSPVNADQDGDGLLDNYDACPGSPGVAWGCPDDDNDGVPNKDDLCNSEWGEYPKHSSGLPALKGGKEAPGCPLKYELAWLGMRVLNDPVISDEGKDDWEPMLNPSATGAGLYQEPYLLFTVWNGGTQGGTQEMWTSRWCCGEKVVANEWEPDNDYSGEEKGSTAQKQGHRVFPEVDGFGVINPTFKSKQAPLVVNVTLMERDWSKEQCLKQDTSINLAESGVVIANGIANCSKSLGLACGLAIGKAIKNIIESIFTNPEPVCKEVDDPDDFQGSVFWHITREDAEALTRDTGAYGFAFEVPRPGASFFATTLKSDLFFCLYREGVPEHKIKQLCDPASKISTAPWQLGKEIGVVKLGN